MFGRRGWLCQFHHQPIMHRSSCLITYKHTLNHLCRIPYGELNIMLEEIKIRSITGSNLQGHSFVFHILYDNSYLQYTKHHLFLFGPFPLKHDILLKWYFFFLIILISSVYLYKSVSRSCYFMSSKLKEPVEKSESSVIIAIDMNEEKSNDR